MKLFSQGPGSFWSEYNRDVAQAQRLARAVAMPLLTEADLEPLPVVVQKYIRLSGAVGHPQVRNFRARFHGQIRSGPNARWMSLTGEQVNFYDPPARLFLMDARRHPRTESHSPKCRGQLPHLWVHWLMGHGEGIWHAPTGNYAYLRFDLDAIEFNVTKV